MPRLKPQASFLPFLSGRYEISTGFTKPVGAGDNDRLIQIDDNYAEYTKQKLAARNEDTDDYVVLPAVETIHYAAAFNTLLMQACLDQPQWFHACNNTCINQLNNSEFAAPGLDPDTNHAYARQQFDELCMQLQEDVVLMQRNTAGEYQAVALHLCLPNNWSARQKANATFQRLHAHVPGMENLNSKGDSILLAAAGKGPYIRFAWGIYPDRHLNMHPAKIETRRPWSEIDLENLESEFFIRVERQVLLPVHREDSLLFLIRTYLYSIRELTDQPGWLNAIKDAILSMSDESLRYKNLFEVRDRLIHWFTQQTKS